MKNILECPDLGTYLLVTETIKKYGPITLTELFKKLEEEAEKTHIETLVDYLYTKKQVDFDKEGRIAWIRK